MSIVPKETITVIAQTIGINKLSNEVCEALVPDVEYRLREIIQESIKCMRHSNRSYLTSVDVDTALKLRNLEPIYSSSTSSNSRDLKFKRALDYKDLFYVDDSDVDFKDIIDKPLPKAPLETSVSAHWLAIEGVQPAIPQNAVPVDIKSSTDNDQDRGDDTRGGVSSLTTTSSLVDVKLPVKHLLSRELQLYFDKITQLSVSRPDSVTFKQALGSLASDSGLHPLLPYFTCFISDELSRSLNNFSLLFALMHLAHSLLVNPHIHIEPYLHQLMPSIITCAVAKRLGNRFTDNHWDLRSFAANLAASICKRFGKIYHNLQPRLTKTLLHAFLDTTKFLPQHYGAIQGLAALGPNVVRLLILPNLQLYLQYLEPEMQLEKQPNKMKRFEAWQVYGALVRAAGVCMYNHFKRFPNSLSTPTRPVLKSNLKVISLTPNKRKANIENMQQQPPLKKVATEGATGVVPLNSLQGVMTGGYSTGGEGSGPATISNDKMKTSAVLAQAWREDMDSGHLVSSLFDVFGDRMFSFTPTPELSLFL